MNTKNIDLIIQYALALAGELDEWKERDLGPIHFIKYVYLADLEYAKSKRVSFTGITWVFHKFGPWSNDVYQRIDGALEAIGARKKSIPSSFNDEDYYRWSITDQNLVRDLEKEIPISIYAALRRDVKEYANDTSSLLHHVYQTLPMLTAAPGEALNLNIQITDHTEEGDFIESSFEKDMKEISNNERRRRKSRVNDLKEQINNKISEKIRQKNKARSEFKPEYNELFLRGVEWLDSLAGQSIEELEGIAEIDPQMWKSPARFDPNVS